MKTFFTAILIVSTAFFSTNTTPVEDTITDEITFACCTETATDADGEVLIKVRTCNSDSDNEVVNQIVSCLEAEALLEQVIQALIPQE